jgi:hypothetical protein
MDGSSLGLLSLFFLPPLVVGGLLFCFWKFSQVQPLCGSARYWRLSWLVLLASGVAFVSYEWLSFLDQVQGLVAGSAHGARLSPEDFTSLHEHTLRHVVWAGAVATLVLLGWPTRRLAALSFGVGVLLVVSGESRQWYVTHHEQEEMRRDSDVLRQAREASSNYALTGWQQPVAAEFQRQVDQRGDIYVPVLLQRAPAFPGGTQALDSTVAARVQRPVIPSAQRLPFAATVWVSCIVEADGQLRLAHVTQGLGPGYDDEAVRVVQSLSPCRPACRDDGQPVAAVWEIAIPFSAN